MDCRRRDKPSLGEGAQRPSVGVPASPLNPPSLAPEPLLPMPNPFVHIELNTSDTRKAKAFYGKLFQWKMSDLPMGKGKYTMIDAGKGPGGGMMKQQMPGGPSAWLPYVHVSDIDAATQKAKKLRATILVDVQEVKGMGWLSVIQDPTGAMLGLWEPK
jgi:predicted enzyme related to lactoylglutathione lyase